MGQISTIFTQTSIETWTHTLLLPVNSIFIFVMYYLFLCCSLITSGLQLVVFIFSFSAFYDVAVEMPFSVLTIGLQSGPSCPFCLRSQSSSPWVIPTSVGTFYRHRTRLTWSVSSVSENRLSEATQGVLVQITVSSDGSCPCCWLWTLTSETQTTALPTNIWKWEIAFKSVCPKGNKSICQANFN